MSFNIKYLSSIWLENSQTRYGEQNKPHCQILPLVHGRNPNHVREQGQRKWHFWISMVSAMSFFSEMVSCPDMNHKIAYWLIP